MEFTKKNQNNIQYAKIAETKRHVIGTDKCSKAAFSGEAEKNTQNDATEPRYYTCLTKTGARTGPLFSVMKCDENNNIVFSKTTLSEYDGAVHDAIVSLYLAGNECMSLNMIYGIITGKKSSDIRLSETQEKQLVTSIYKLSNTWVHIDNSDEVTVYNENIKDESKKIKLIIQKSRCINFDEIEIHLNCGQKIEGIRLLNEPILYEYANNIHQIQSDPLNIMKTPILKTEENITIQRYLYRQVNRIRSKGKASEQNRILHDTLFKDIKLTREYIPVASTYRSKKKRTIETIQKILNYWSSDEIGLIYKYILDKDGILIFTSQVTWEKYKKENVVNSKIEEDI